jgi:hypothetical protein
LNHDNKVTSFDLAEFDGIVQCHWNTGVPYFSMMVWHFSNGTPHRSAAIAIEDLLI